MAKLGRGSPKAMRLFEGSVESPDLRDLIANLEANTTDTVHAVLEFVRKDVLYFLKSYTDVQRPPRYQRKFVLKEGLYRVKVPNSDRTGWRPAHPGGWADISGDLKKRYYTDLQLVNGAWRLAVGNRSEHAAYVEAMDGFFVVSGVLEPGGPVARSIRRALTALGVSWRIVPGGRSMADSTGSEASLGVTPQSGVAPPPTVNLGGDL